MMMGVPVVKIGPVRMGMHQGGMVMPMRVFCRGRQADVAMRVMTVIVAVTVSMGYWRMHVQVRMALDEQQRDASREQ